jgi:hypothetical protein
VSVSPRPTGRSGWQTTPTTVATSVRASRQGTEKLGVPKKMVRIVNVFTLDFLFPNLDIDFGSAEFVLGALHHVHEGRGNA